ncbi:fibronectin type III domain protein, partial [Opisthorchis viverrini]
MKMKVDWTGTLNLLEQITQVHLLYNEDGKPKSRIAKQADGHLLVDVPTGHLDCNMLFAVENHAGISPFTTVPVPARHHAPVISSLTSVIGHFINLPLVVAKHPALPIPQNLRMKAFIDTSVHSVVWSPVSPDCDITYVVQTKIRNSGGEITVLETETKQTELKFSDINPLNFYLYSVKTRNGNGEASDLSLPVSLETKEAIRGKLSFEVRHTDDNTATISWYGELHKLSHAEELILVITGGEIPSVINAKVKQMQLDAKIPDVQGDITFYAAARNPSGLSAFQELQKCNNLFALVDRTFSTKVSSAQRINNLSSVAPHQNETVRECLKCGPSEYLLLEAAMSDL